MSSFADDRHTVQIDLKTAANPHKHKQGAHGAFLYEIFRFLIDAGIQQVTVQSDTQFLSFIPGPTTSAIRPYHMKAPNPELYHTAIRTALEVDADVAAYEGGIYIECTTTGCKYIAKVVGPRENHTISLLPIDLTAGLATLEE